MDMEQEEVTIPFLGNATVDRLQNCSDGGKDKHEMKDVVRTPPDCSGSSDDTEKPPRESPATNRRFRPFQTLALYWAFLACVSKGRTILILMNN